MIFHCRFHRQRIFGLYAESNYVDWLNELINRVKVGRSVRSRLDMMGITCRSIIDLTYRQFQPFIAIAEDHPRGIEFVIDELMSIINDPDRYFLINLNFPPRLLTCIFYLTLAIILKLFL